MPQNKTLRHTARRSDECFADRVRAAQRDGFVFLRVVLDTFVVDLSAVGLGVAGFGLSVELSSPRRTDAFFGLGLNVLSIFFFFCFAI